MALKQQLAAWYRAAAARGRTLLTVATSPWLKERLGAEISRCEQIAEGIERATEPDANGGSPRRVRAWRGRRPPSPGPRSNEPGSEKNP